ncbi:flagellar basal body rod modification protein [bacterium BMS3Abin04]|nr:flagellar basal body rod modification protein [bacterium BMS3Abin04]
MDNLYQKFIRLTYLFFVISIFGFAQLYAQVSINKIGDFEGNLPSYWQKGSEPNGSQLEWSTTESRSMGRSLMITKGVTDTAAVWESENMADFWSPQHYKDVDIFVGAWIKTEGINTNPATEDEKWTISYTFYDSTGTLIGVTELPIDQSTSSSGAFYADTNAVGQTILPKDSWKTIIKVTGGKNATGTVYADDFMLYGRNGAWAGQDWDASVGVPTGWIYWLPPNGGNDGKLSNGFENTVVTTEEAHSGLHSLKFDLPFTRDPHDAFVGTKRMLLDGTSSPNTTSMDNKSIRIADLSNTNSTTAINPGDWVRIKVWVKASNLVPDSAALYPTTWAAGFTYGFWKGNGNNDGWNALDGYPKDMQFKFPAVTSFDWTPYYIDVQVPNTTDAKAISVRLHAYARFTGTVYFDDLSVEKIDGVTGIKNNNVLPAKYQLFQNYPNPFNPTTKISYTLPSSSNVTLKIYDMLGREVKTLVNKEQNAGAYNLTWDGTNNNGNLVTSGMYIYQIHANNFIKSSKMILMK